MRQSKTVTHAFTAAKQGPKRVFPVQTIPFSASYFNKTTFRIWCNGYRRRKWTR